MTNLSNIQEKQFNYTIAFRLCVLFTSLFFLLSPHLVNGSNDGASIALVRNWINGKLYYDEQTFPYSGGVSFALVGDKRLPDRNIGIPLLTFPLLALMEPIKILGNASYRAPDIELPMPGTHEDDEDVFPIHSLLCVVTYALLALFGGASVSLLYLLFSQRCHAPALNIFLASTFVLGTCFLPFSVVLFVHVASVFFVLLSLFLYYRIREKQDRAKHLDYAMLGACLGFMSLIDYTLAIYGFGMLLMMLTSKPFFGASRQVMIGNVAILGIAGSVFVALCLVYNTVALGGPFLTPYSLHGFYLYTHTLSGFLSGKLSKGLGLLFSVSRNGALIASPMIIFGLLAIKRNLQNRAYDLCILLGVVIAHVTFSAKLREWDGAVFYPRYILWSIMIMCVLSGFWFIDEYKKGIRREFSFRFIACCAFVLCAAYSLYMSFAHFSYPGQSKHMIFALQPSWIESFHSLSLYGIADWPMLLWIISLLFFIRSTRHYFVQHHNAALIVTALSCMGIVMFPLYYVTHNSWPMRGEIPVDFNKECVGEENCAYSRMVDNFYKWSLPANPQSVMVQAHDLTNAGGSILYPQASNKEGAIRYNISQLFQKSRRRLKLDFTLTTASENYIEIRVIYDNGVVRKLYNRHSDGIEKRYALMLDLNRIPQYERVQYLEIAMFVDAKAVTNADARVHTLAIY